MNALPITYPPVPTADQAWFKRLSSIQRAHVEVSPRGLPCLEGIEPAVVRVDPQAPLMLLAERKLNYKFAAAEALWIINGDDRVETIAPYNKNIAQFSDDGERFYGAYGPRLAEQSAYVAQAIVSDPATRQATMTLWRPNPRPSKDIPCTVAFSFYVRNSVLWTTTYMRSSDVFLGLPYDMLNFSMIARYVAYLVHRYKPDLNLSVGPLTIYIGSSHLYIKDKPAVLICQEAMLRGSYDLDEELVRPRLEVFQSLEAAHWPDVERALTVMRENGLKTAEVI